MTELSGDEAGEADVTNEVSQGQMETRGEEDPGRPSVLGPPAVRAAGLSIYKVQEN